MKKATFIKRQFSQIQFFLYIFLIVGLGFINKEMGYAGNIVTEHILGEGFT